VLLPLALLGLLGLHFYLIQRHGVAAPGRPVGDEGVKGNPYFPHHTFKEALVGVGVAVGLFAISWWNEAPLEALAEPSDTSYVPRPDWYFLGLFELLKLFDQREIGTFWIPTAFVIALILLPFVDRGKERHWKKRRLMTPVGIITCITIITLTVMGWRDNPNAKEQPAAPKAGEKLVIEGLTLPFPLGYTNLERRGYLMVRRLKCMDCHNHVEDEDDKDKPTLIYGHVNEEDDTITRLGDLEVDTVNDLVEALAEPPEGMPEFTSVSDQDRLAIGAFILRFQSDYGAALRAAREKKESGNSKKDGK
jgi:hypothetical protein